MICYPKVGAYHTVTVPEQSSFFNVLTKIFRSHALHCPRWDKYNCQMEFSENFKWDRFICKGTTKIVN